MEPISVTQQTSLSQEESIAEFAAGSGHTSMRVKMDLIDPHLQLTVILTMHILTV